MSIMNHTIQVLDPQGNPDFLDRIILGQKIAVANGVGGGAGASVAVAVTFLEGLPQNYQVLCTMSQDATYWITAKTSTGFTVNLSPRLAANTLAAGSFDLLVIGA